ncbi:hypothetical protein EKO04_001160 [Ascochyta lentis]|uniref:Uncharacterized protein n=1 Tax=Ascochyta lentis TaxID=205686 RepID=A0A8H7JC55_9PLEO|nr:hypothetical protein EKO04_001160 [Ascochyta lentis]
MDSSAPPTMSPSEVLTTTSSKLPDTVPSASEDTSSSALEDTPPSPLPATDSLELQATPSSELQATPSSELQAESITPSRFLELPAELRLQIYEELVVVGKVFYTPGYKSLKSYVRFKDYSNYTKPSLAILRVCKTTHKEAEDVYLSKNLFVLPPNFSLSQPFTNKQYFGHRPLFSTAAFARLKHVSIELSSRSPDAPTTMDAYIWDPTTWQVQVNFHQQTAVERLQDAHDQAVKWFFLRLDKEVQALTLIPALRSLELDYSNAYCPLACCRLLGLTGAWSYLTDELAPAKSIRVVGLRDEGEEEQVLTSWSDVVEDSGGEGSTRHVIEFGEKKVVNVPQG